MTTLTPFDSRDPVNETKGGTNQSSYTTGDILYASASNTLSKLSIGSTGDILSVSASSIPEWATSGGAGDGTNYLNTVYIVDDMINGVTGGGGVLSQYIWDFFGQSGASILDSAHPGTFSIASAGGGSPAAYFCVLGSDVSGGFYPITFGGGTTRLDFIFKIPTLSVLAERYVMRVGFMDIVSNGSVDPNNGAWFQYSDNVNSGNWQIKTANGGTTTTQNTSTAANTSWHRMTVLCNAAGTSVNFYIDDVEVNNSPLTTNIPTSNPFSVGVSGNKTSGTVATIAYVDLTVLKIDLTNSR